MISGNRKYRFVLPGAIALMAAANAFAASYYVSPKGDDQNDGTDASRAWKTAGHVKAAKFQPDDRILFERGGEWHEQLIASSSGSAGHPITYADYGDAKAAKPTFWGSDVVPAAAFTKTGDSSYTVSASVLPTGVGYWVFADHAFLHAATGSTDMPAKSFFISGSTIYINTGGVDPSKGEVVYTISDRAQGVNSDSSLICSNGNNHLVFENLIGRETAAVAPGGDLKDGVPDAYVYRFQGSSDIRLNHCEAFNGGKHHFGVINTTGFVGTDIHAAGCIPAMPYGHASAFVSFSDAGRHGDTSQWIDCTVDHFDSAQLSFITHGEGIGNLLIQNMRSEGCSMAISTENSSEVVVIRGGELAGPSCDVYGKNVLIDGMRLSASSKLDLFGDRNIIQNCIDDKNNQGEGGIVCRGKNNVIRLNTLAHQNGPCIDLKSSAEHTRIVGNLFTGGARAINDEGSKDSSISYNFYDNTKNPAAGLDGDKHLVQGDPKFDPTSRNYALGAGSGAINIVPATEITGVAKDYAGARRLVGPGYDAGAMEAQGNGK